MTYPTVLIHSTNVTPILDDLIIPPGVEVIKGVPTEMNVALLDGRVSLANISSVEFVRHADRLAALRDFSVSVLEVLLLRRLRLRWMVLVALLTAGTAVAAPPVVVEMNGDLYVKQAGGLLRRLTTYGGNFAPLVSPDGRWVVYSSRPGEIRPEDYFGSGLPVNLWLMQLSNRVAVRLLRQPAPSLHVEIKVSQPNWSPDSSRLIWTQQTPDRSQSGLHRTELMVYTPATASMKRMPTRAVTDDVAGLLSPEWGPDAQMAAAGNFDDSGGGVIVYRPDETWTAFKSPASHPFVYDLTWIDRETVQVSAPDGTLVRLNIQTGRWETKQ